MGHNDPDIHPRHAACEKNKINLTFSTYIPYACITTRAILIIPYSFHSCLHFTSHNTVVVCMYLIAFQRHWPVQCDIISVRRINLYRQLYNNTL